MAPLIGYSLSEYLRQTARSPVCPKCHGIGTYPVLLHPPKITVTQWCEVCDGQGYLNRSAWRSGDILFQNCTPYDPYRELNQGDAACVEDNTDPL